MKSQQRVFAFEDPVEYLNYELKERQRKDVRFSIREWARQVGYANPSYLSEVLRRRRKLTVDLAAKLAVNLGLEGKSYRYFELTVLLQKSLSEKEKQFYSQLLRSLRPTNLQSINRISLESFNLVSDWYHWAILEMTNLADFSSSEKAIAERLATELEPRAVRAAIERLIRTRFLVRDAAGGLHRADQKTNLLDAKMAALAAREYQRQMAKQALLSLDTQEPGQIDFQGTTLAFRTEDMQKACAILREAHKKLLELSADRNGEEVYQLNTQFFRLTQKKGAKKRR